MKRLVAILMLITLNATARDAEDNAITRASPMVMTNIIRRIVTNTVTLMGLTNAAAGTNATGVTNITAGYGLTGGTVTNIGTFGVNSNTIPSFTQMTNWLAGLQQTNTITLSNVMTAVLDHSRTNTWKYPADPQDTPGIPGGLSEWDTNYTVATITADGSLYTLDYYSQMQWGDEGGGFDAGFEAHLWYRDIYGGRTNQLFYAYSGGGDYDYTVTPVGSTSNQFVWYGSVQFQPLAGTTVVLSNRYVNSLDAGIPDTRATNVERFVIYARTNQSFTTRAMVWPN